MTCLVWLIQRRVGRLDWRRLMATALRTVLATGLMSACSAGAMTLLPFGDGRWQQILSVFGPVTLGIASFFAAARLTGLVELNWLLSRHVPEPTASSESEDRL
jgi:hypothetical protein